MADADGDNEEYWEGIRGAFPTTAALTYLDNANKALFPTAVMDGIGAWHDDIVRTGGRRAFSIDVVEETRVRLAAYLGAPADCIAIMRNTSEGINTIAACLRLQPGDEVVVGASEHPSGGFPWRHLERNGVVVRVLPVDEQGRIPLSAVERVLGPRTRVVSMSWVTYDHGFRLKVKELADLCRAAGVFSLIDGIQAVGLLDVPLVDLGVDALACGGHKGLCGVTGTGFLYVRKDILPGMVPPYVGRRSFTSEAWQAKDLELRGDARRFEYGQPNTLGNLMLSRSLEFLATIGLRKIERRIEDLTSRLIDRAHAAGLRIRTPREWGDRGWIVSIEVSGSAERVVDLLRQRNVVVSPTRGRIRASIHFYNSVSDVDRFIAEILGIIKQGTF